MNRKNKATAKSTPTPPKPSPPAPTVSTKPTPTATKASPPQPKSNESARLRQEWQNFETWLKDRRQEKDKRLNEARSKAKLSGNQSRYRSSARSAQNIQNVDLVALERSLDEEFATQARTEWLRRLDANNLDEEKWTDITDAEMQTVEATFALADFSAVENARHDARHSLSGSTLSGTPISVTPSRSFGEDPSWGWNAHPSVLPQSAAASGSGLRQESKPKGRTDPTSAKSSVPPAPEESLWDKVMKEASNNSSRTSGGQTARTPDGLKPSKSGAPPESLWEMKMKGIPGTSQNKTAGNIPPNPPLSDESESLWMKVNGKGAATKENEPATADPVVRYDRWGWPIVDGPQESSSESLWDKKMNGGAGKISQTNKPAKSSPLATQEPEIAEADFHNTFGLRSPSLVEVEYGAFLKTDEKGLTNKTMEASIREFYSDVAEKEIVLRKKWSTAATVEDVALRMQLVGDFMKSVNQQAHSVFDGWVATQLAAEEKRKAEQLRTTQAAGMKRTPATTTPGATPASQQRTQTPEPTRSKKQAKKAAATAKKKEVVTAEEPSVNNASSPAEPRKVDAAPPRAATPGLSYTSKTQNGRNNLSPWATMQQRESASTPSPSSNTPGKTSFPPRATTPMPSKARRPYQATVSDDIEEEQSSSSSSDDQEEGLTTPESEKTEESSSSGVSSPFNWMGGQTGKNGSANASASRATTNPFAASTAPTTTRQPKGFRSTGPPSTSAAAPAEDVSTKMHFWMPPSTRAPADVPQEEDGEDELFNTISMYTQTAKAADSRARAGKNVYRSR
ncbi:unnamed protein product [Somion occarium]|uniref:Uncharacterized protein n=1 Tax=Somion occarium TaxID=3059160 RepID=A0ABP1DR20_9APHY